MLFFAIYCHLRLLCGKYSVVINQLPRASTTPHRSMLNSIRPKWKGVGAAGPKLLPKPQEIPRKRRPSAPASSPWHIHMPTYSQIKIERNVKNSEITELCQLSQKSRVIFSLPLKAAYIYIHIPGEGKIHTGECHRIFVFIESLILFRFRPIPFPVTPAKDFPLNFMLIMPLSSWATFKRVSSLSAP